MTPAFSEQFRRWFEYEKDSHRKVLASLESVPPARRDSEPFRKALNIFGHMIAARQVWLSRLDSSATPPANLFPQDAALALLPQQLAAMEQGWTGYFNRLDDAELARIVSYRTSQGESFRSVVLDILTQLYGHSLYHRGQIAALVRSVDGTPAVTDFIFWTREAVAPQAR
jgi:uncharacterized damage-inducible protein DinB